MQYIGPRLLISIALCFLVLPSNPLHAQSYLTSTGSPPFALPQPVEKGFIETASGNLHLEFPLVSLPQRGTTLFLAPRLVYDAHNVWNSSSFDPNTNNHAWQPSGAVWYNYGFGGWTVSDGGTSGNISGEAGCYTDFNIIDTSGTQRTLRAYIGPTKPSGACTGVGSGYALDSSGYLLKITDWSNVCPIAAIYAPDGTKVWEHTDPVNRCGSGGNLFISNGPVTAEDSNGNQIVNTGYTGDSLGALSLQDTLGRVPTTTTLCGTTAYCYHVPNSQGGTSQYQVNFTTVTLKTQFGQPGVEECQAFYVSCIVQVVSSVLLPDSTSYSFTYDCDSSTSAACSSLPGQSAYYGLMTSMTLPTGGVIKYTNAVFVDAQSNHYTWLTSRQAGSGTWSYTPKVLTTCSQGGVGCQEQVTAKRPSGDYTVTTFTIDNGSWPTQILSYDAAGNLLSTLKSTWDFTNLCPTPNCPGHAYIRKLSETVTLPVVAGSITKQTQYSYDSPQKGNVTALKEWWFRAGTSPTFPSVPDRGTYKTYLSTGDNIINKPLSITICNSVGSDSDCIGGGSKISQTKLTYDSYGAGGLTTITGVVNHDDANFGASLTARGNPTQISRWVGATTYLSSQSSYDTTGQVLNFVDAALNSTTFSYADNFYDDNGANPPAKHATTPPGTNAYVTSTTAPLIGVETQGYYFGTGRTGVVTDQNAVSSYFHFLDSMDRATNSYLPVGWKSVQYTSPTAVDVYEGIADVSPVNGCQSCQHHQHVYDVLGREISEQLVNNPDGATEVDSVYDSTGRTQQVSHPYYSGGTPVFEVTQYDGLDRSVSVSHPDSNSILSAFGSAVGTSGGQATQLCAASYGIGYPELVKDESGHKRQIWRDGFLRTIETDEPDSTGKFTLSSCYGYNVLDELTQVVQGVQTRTYQYDGLGRPTNIATPEGGSDQLFYTTAQGGQCAGAPGAVCRRIDARGVTTTYSYDALNRLLQKVFSDGTGAVGFSYDQGGASAFALGRRTSMTDPTGSESYSYDQMGRVTKVAKVLFSKTYNVTYVYNVAGEVTQVKYPSSTVFQNSYDAIGRLCAVASSTTNCATFTNPIATSYKYNVAGQESGFTYGNGVSATFSYSSDRLQLTGLSYAKGTSTLFSLNYWYKQDSTNCPSGTTGNNGQIQCIVDNVQSGRSESYAYDNVRQLAAAATTGSTAYPQWVLGETLDRYGNRQAQKFTVGTGPNVTLAFNQTTNQPVGYTYDKSGNLTLEPLGVNFNYGYDAEDRLNSFTSSSAGATYQYDGHGQRVQKAVQGGTTTVYVYAAGRVIAEYDNGAGPGSPSRQYVYGSGRLLTTISAGKKTYHHADQLSVRLSTDSTGKVVGEQGHFPYGENWYSTNTTTKWFFTSYERDPETGLDYAMARFYDSRIAAFCSADPVGGAPEAPESWNRYAYVRNDPVNLTDASGQDWWDEVFEFFGFDTDDENENSPQQQPSPVPFGTASDIVYPSNITLYVYHSEWLLNPQEFVLVGQGSGLDYGDLLKVAVGAADAATAKGAKAALQRASKEVQKQKLNKKKCKDDLAKLNTTADAVRQGAKAAEFINGVGSTVPLSSTYAGSPIADLQRLAPSIQGTVGEEIAQPGVVAVSDLGGHRIFFNPDLISVKDFWVNVATVFHETLHNITGLTDTDLQKSLGLPQDKVSKNISDKLSQDCF